MRIMAKRKRTIATAFELAEQNKEEIRSLIKYMNEVYHIKIANLEMTVRKLEKRMSAEPKSKKFNLTLTDDEGTVSDADPDLFTKPST